MLLQGCWAPGIGSVAVITLQPKHTCVDIRLFVTLVALGRCAAEDFIRMACITLKLCVLTIQGEECRMVKIAQPVNAIMARHAVSAELLLVVSHEFFVMLRMAIDARLDVQGFQIGWMASGARDRQAGVIGLVKRQAEPGRRQVIKGLIIQFGR